VFDSEEDCFAAVKGARDPARRRRRHPLRGPGGRAGHARDAARDGSARRRRARRGDRVDHRRPLLGRHARTHGRPHRARSGARRSASGRARRRRDRDRRREPPSRSRISGDELAERLAAWQAPAPRYTKGVFAKYAAQVGSASEGAPTW
jgi:hypothetical protein